MIKIKGTRPPALVENQRTRLLKKFNNNSHLAYQSHGGLVQKIK